MSGILQSWEILKRISLSADLNEIVRRIDQPNDFNLVYSNKCYSVRKIPEYSLWINYFGNIDSCLLLVLWTLSSTGQECKYFIGCNVVWQKNYWNTPKQHRKTLHCLFVIEAMQISFKKLIEINKCQDGKQLEQLQVCQHPTVVEMLLMYLL